jgi:phage FluMu protein Com
MTEVRCKKCNRLLMKAVIVEGEIICPKCKYLQDIFHIDDNFQLAKQEKVQLEDCRIIMS